LNDPDARAAGSYPQAEAGNIVIEEDSLSLALWQGHSAG
jgi:hypothetical protein